MSIKDIAKPWVKNLGVYEPGRPIEEVARELGFECEEVLKLASNENSLGPSPLAIKAMNAEAGRMHLYPDGGAYYLKQSLAKRLDLSPENIIVTNGSNEAIEFLGHVFLERGTNIVMADRAFVVYKLIAAMFQAETIAAPMANFTHYLDAMLGAITPSTKIVFVANPNNPTGTMVDGKAIDRFMSKVPDHVVVAFDEAYIDLLPESQQPDTLKYVREGRQVFVMRTFSKTYGLAGLRIGYTMGAPEAIQLLQRVRQPFNVNAMGQAAAVAALDDVQYVQQARAMVKDGLEQLGRGFAELEYEYVPSVANFVLVKVGRGREAFEDLQRRKVIVRPMDAYGLPDYVRVTVGTGAENELVLKAMAEMKKDRALK